MAESDKSDKSENHYKPARLCSLPFTVYDLPFTLHFAHPRGPAGVNIAELPPTPVVATVMLSHDRDIVT